MQQNLETILGNAKKGIVTRRRFYRKLCSDFCEMPLKVCISREHRHSPYANIDEVLELFGADPLSVDFCSTHYYDILLDLRERLQSTDYVTCGDAKRALFSLGLFARGIIRNKNWGKEVL